MLVLAEHGVLGGADLAAHSQALVAVVGIAALVGFGSKAGLVPLHMWLPRTHPVAPEPPVGAHVGRHGQGRALRADPRPVLVAERPPRCGWGWRSWSSARSRRLGGILAAIVQDELKRLLAYSTIENVGMIALASGRPSSWRDPALACGPISRLAGALLHVLNHAVMKAGLFLSAGSVERATGEHRLDHLGGLLRRMPWTGAAFGVTILGIAGVPLLAGFASEWLILEALVHGVILAGTGGGDRERARVGRPRRHDRRRRGVLREARWARPARPAAQPGPRDAARSGWRCGRAWSCSPARASRSGPSRGSWSVPWCGCSRSRCLSGRTPGSGCPAPGACRRWGSSSSSGWRPSCSCGCAAPDGRRTRVELRSAGRSGLGLDLGRVLLEPAMSVGGLVRTDRTSSGPPAGAS